MNGARIVKQSWRHFLNYSGTLPTKLPPHSVIFSRSLQHRHWAQKSPASQSAPESFPDARVCFLPVSIQTVPEFAPVAREFLNFSPAVQSPREMDKSFHPPYVAPRETPAHCIPDPQPRP